MKWHCPVAPRASVAFGILLTCVSFASPAAAEDPRLACATSAEQAQQLRSEHKLQEARRELLVCGQPLCPAVVRADCIHWLSEVDKSMPSVVIKATDPANEDLIEVTVSVDGVRAIDKLDGLARAVDPGVHVFRFEAKGMITVEQQVVIREGEDRRMLAVQLRPQPIPIIPVTSTAAPVLPYVLAGVGTLALGSFAYFGISGRMEASDLASGCGANKSCSESQVDPVRQKLLVADLSLGVSLVTLGIATYLFVSHERARPPEHATIQVSAGRAAAALKVGLNF